MLLLHVGQVRPQPLVHDGRQHRPTVLLALAAPDHDLIEIEVDVLHAKLEAFLQAKPGAVQQRDDDPGHGRQRFQDSSDLVPAQDHRRRVGVRARGTCWIALMSCCNNSRYKKSRAQSAWFCVEALIP